MYQDILKYTKTVDHYNTHDFSVFLYSLIKMQKPKCVLELGTGFGVTSFLAAQACKENNKGKVITVDSGLQWDQLTKYEHYMQHSTIRFSLGKHLEFINKDINCVFNMKIKPDIIFNDVSCEPIFQSRAEVVSLYSTEVLCRGGLLLFPAHADRVRPPRGEHGWSHPAHLPACTCA